MGKKPAPLFTAYPFFFEPDSLIEELRQLHESGLLSNRGPGVHGLEKQIVDSIQAPGWNAVTCANGTLGLELALRALEIRGKVIVTPLTFVASAHSIVNAGLEPVFCDIDPETLCLSPKAVEKALSSGIGAVMPVHVYGNVCDVEYFESLRKKGIRIIYDAAHAFGVSFKGQSVAHWGDAAVFSLHATKIVTTCEGGVVTTLDPDLARKIQHLTDFGFTGTYEVEMVGTNAKMSEVHALFGLHSLRQLPATITARKAVCERYKQNLKDFPALRLLPPQANVEQNYQYLPVFLQSKALRDGLDESLKHSNIFSRKYFYPAVNQLLPYRSSKSFGVSVAEQTAERVLCLPLNAALTLDQVDFVCERIRNFLSDPGQAQ